MSTPQVLRQHGRTVTGEWPHPIVSAIRERREFRSGALTGRRTLNGNGRLPADYSAALRADEPTYVVYSYATPIGWHGRRGWIIPDKNYSHTTTRHQRFVRQAAS